MKRQRGLDMFKNFDGSRLRGIAGLADDNNVLAGSKTRQSERSNPRGIAFFINLKLRTLRGRVDQNLARDHDRYWRGSRCPSTGLRARLLDLTDLQVRLNFHDARNWPLDLYGRSRGLHLRLGRGC